MDHVATALWPGEPQYLTGLGITAVELLPVHDHVDEASLVRRGLRDYWGYNSTW